MKETVKVALASSLMFIFSLPAQAFEPYVGAGFGVYSLGNGVTKGTVTGGYVQLGHDFSEFFGAEVRIGASGNTGEELTPQPRMGIDYFAAAYLKPRYEFSDQFMAYALLGVATMRASYSEAALPKQRKTRTGYAYGLGLQYQLNDDYSVGGEFSHMLSKPATNATAIKTNFQGLETNAFSMSAKYHF
jgi:opacity protein-like surface antigen